MSSYTKWISFELACRLRCLQQGALGAGNTQQNIVSLLATCRTNANSTATFARWNPTLKNGAAQPVQALQVFPALVPGFKKPIAS